jgi:hypothetical protein
MYTLGDGGHKGQALTHAEQNIKCSLSASSGCFYGRFSAPSECRKAGETTRTLHHVSLGCYNHDPRFPDAVLLRLAMKG